QTSFAEAVRDLGLERGIEGSRATHQRVQSYYGAIERQPGHATITPQAIAPRVLRKGIFSKDVATPEAVADRVTAAVREGYGPTVA
ncbi:plasmid recombination enzyme, partial [Klebsiella pneumoniae]